MNDWHVPPVPPLSNGQAVQARLGEHGEIVAWRYLDQQTPSLTAAEIEALRARQPEPLDQRTWIAADKMLATLDRDRAARDAPSVERPDCAHRPGYEHGHWCAQGGGSDSEWMAFEHGEACSRSDVPRERAARDALSVERLAENAAVDRLTRTILNIAKGGHEIARPATDLADAQRSLTLAAGGFRAIWRELDDFLAASPSRAERLEPGIFAPPLPVHGCECSACRYLARKQAEFRAALDPEVEQAHMRRMAEALLAHPDLDAALDPEARER